jgi:predicted Rossmann-fold nucleotide-binding protein
VSGEPYVAVVGSGVAAGELYEKAKKVGWLVAERGGTIVCGGLSG